jgi:hypothetical protein
MRNYPSDSPESMGRLVALTLLADGAIDASELKQLDHKDTIRRLGCGYQNSAGQLELDVKDIDLLLAEVQHPVLQKQVLRMMLDIVNADRKLSGGEAVLVAEAMKFWGIDLYEVADTSIPTSSLRVQRRHESAWA